MTEEAKQEVEQHKFILPKKYKVGIIGCADSKKDAPFNQPEEWEFWGVNNLHLTIPKAPWSRWFEIHSITHDGRQYLRRGTADFRGQPVEPYLKSLNDLNIPVYMQRPWPVIPHAVEYPIKEVLQQFGNYFTNTISYMIALAIYEGFKTIGIWGVDMAVDTEYFWQRPSCEYFIGIARGRGTEVIIPDECDLLKTRYLYGFQEIQEMAFAKKTKSMMDNMKQRLAEAENKREMARKQADQYVGAISAAQEMMKIWKNV